ncbi:MAG: hypothetical protein ABL986_14840 [Vicinamibacterales bacterium]
MTNSETRRLEMLLRVQEFGRTHQDLFPPSSPGGEIFDALAAVVTRLDEHAMSKRSTARDGRTQKNTAREDVLTHLDTISRCARIIANDVPGFDDKYKVGRLRSNQAILTAGKTFAREAALSSGVFIKYGLRETFLEQLNASIEACDVAVRAWQVARDGHTSARANIDAALDEGMALIKRLDIIVTNRVGDDSGAIAVWERDRKVELPRRSRHTKDAGEQAQDVTPEKAA